MTVTSETKTAPHTPLSRLEMLLRYLDFDVHFLPKGEESPFEALLVALDETQTQPETPATPESEHDYAYVAQIFFNEDLLQSEQLPEIQRELEQAVTLQFLIHTSLDASALSPERLLELYRFLTTCNRVLPLGHFDLDPDQQLFLHYGLRAENRDLPATLVVDTLENFAFFVNRMAPLVQELIATERPLAELVTALEQTLAAAVQQYIPQN